MKAFLIGLCLVQLALNCGITDPVAVSDCTNSSNTVQSCCLSERKRGTELLSRKCVAFNRVQALVNTKGTIKSFTGEEEHTVTCGTSAADGYFFGAKLCGAGLSPTNYQSCTDQGTAENPCCYLEYELDDTEEFPFQADGKICLEGFAEFGTSGFAQNYFDNAEANMLCNKDGIIRAYKASSATFLQAITFVVLLILLI